MESKAKRGPRQPESCLPNTIVIQLVSAQPQTMPISVRAMPLLPGSKSTVEQPRRPAPPAPNRSKSPCPPRLQSTTTSPQLRRRAPTDEYRYSPPQGTHTNNEPQGQGRTIWMEYVYHPEEKMTPINSPPPLDDLQEAVCHCGCHNCRSVRRTIPEPDNFMGNQASPRLNDMPQTRQEGRRDQSTITDDQPQPLESLKTICETLGQAIVAAAIATAQAANTFYSPADTPIPRKDKGLEVNAHSFLKTSFLSDIELLGDTQSTTTRDRIRGSTQESIIYPKTPIESPLRLPKSADRMPSGSSPEVYTRSNQIIQRRPNSVAGGLPVRTFPKVNQISAGVKVQQGTVIRRRFPTEDCPLFKQRNNSGPTSPTAAMPVTKQSAAKDLPQDLNVVTLPPHPDLASFSQTDDPCLSSNDQ